MGRSVGLAFLQYSIFSFFKKDEGANMGKRSVRINTFFVYNL